MEKRALFCSWCTVYWALVGLWACGGHPHPVRRRQVAAQRDIHLAVTPGAGATAGAQLKAVGRARALGQVIPHQLHAAARHGEYRL
jgi:hypothetical protein